MDERFYAGIREFNDGRFYEAHEILEDLWHEYRDVDRTFLQGLIQLSAAFYHFQCRNWKGAVSQLTKGLNKLEMYRPEHRGVELARFLQEIRKCLDASTGLLSGKDVNPDTVGIPKIVIDAIPVP